MEAILTTFGIDWRLLAINALNFGLLLLGLWYFFYAPLMRMLEARQQKIAEGVAAADRAQEELRALEASRAERLAAAGAEADKVVADARHLAERRAKETIASSERAAELLLEEAGKASEEMKTRALSESKEELARLVVLGVEKVLAQK